MCEGEAVWGRVRRSGVCGNGRVRVCVCVCVCEDDYVGVGGVECEMSVRWGISPHDSIPHLQSTLHVWVND